VHVSNDSVIADGLVIDRRILPVRHESMTAERTIASNSRVSKALRDLGRHRRGCLVIRGAVLGIWANGWACSSGGRRAASLWKYEPKRFLLLPSVLGPSSA